MPLALPEAYSLAVAHVGAATNRLWCVSASCLEEAKSFSFVTRWTFGFSNTNGEITRVIVFFDKTVGHMEGAAIVGGTLK